MDWDAFGHASAVIFVTVVAGILMLRVIAYCLTGTLNQKFAKLAVQLLKEMAFFLHLFEDGRERR